MSEYFYLQWHLTNRCKNRCLHCYQTSFDGKDVSYERAKIIVEDFANCCSTLETDPYIALTGGDPLLNPDFWKILNLVRQLTPSISILGNPELLITDNCKPIEKLKDFDIHDYQLSLDGSQLTHDRIRSVGSFDRTIKAIKCLVKAQIPVTVMSTISKDNCSEMVDILRLCHSFGVSEWSFARHVPTNNFSLLLSPADYLDFLKAIVRTEEYFDSDTQGFVEKDPLLILVNGSCDVTPQQKVAGGCGLGSSMLTLLPDDTLMACRRHTGSVIGKWSPDESFLQHFVYNKKMEMFREISRIKGCNKCKYLYHCRGCRALAYASTGDFWGEDPQCPVAQEYKNMRR